ncbi:MAG: hypothetical protein M3O41_06805 [Pseudomonadota bacterium]|nr:hypothetical protein [Pseudomonadota bacterium]
MATPTIGAWYNVILSKGTANHDIHAHAHVALPGTEEGFRAELETEGAANVIQQEIKFSPGGTTGGHTHPGILLLSLAADSGPVDWYDAECEKRVYNAGDSWTEGTKLHDVVNSAQWMRTSWSRMSLRKESASARMKPRRLARPRPDCNSRGAVLQPLLSLTMPGNENQFRFRARHLAREGLAASQVTQ